jgi:hypothetical protein
MAKKRRKPHPRSRPHPTTRSAVETVERPRAGRRGDADGASDRGGAQTRPAPPSSRSRAEKKELARQQREEIRRRVRRAELARRAAWALGIAAVLAAGVLWFTRDTGPTTLPETLPGELKTEAPWDANASQLADRLDLLGLPAAGTTMHEHANLQIFVHGDQEPVPANIGLDGDLHAPLHTHETSGTVHMESDQIRDFTLGEFFDVWGVQLTERCLGAYCEDGQSALRLFEDGVEVTGSIRNVVLKDQTVYVLTFGTEDELPDPIPDSFDFASVPQ